MYEFVAQCMKESGGLSSKRGSVRISYQWRSHRSHGDIWQFNLQISSISVGLGGVLSLTPPSLRHNTSPFGLLLFATLSAINWNLMPHLHHPLIRSFQSYLNSLASSWYIQQRWMSRALAVLTRYFFVKLEEKKKEKKKKRIILEWRLRERGRPHKFTNPAGTSIEQFLKEGVPHRNRSSVSSTSPPSLNLDNKEMENQRA